MVFVCVRRAWLSGAGLAAVLGACAPAGWPPARNPAAELAGILTDWRSLRGSGSHCEAIAQGAGAPRDCEQLQDALERLHVQFPRDVELLFASAVLTYQGGAPERAQSQLDALLARAPAHARAAALRARIALEQGNLPFARALLERSVELAPDAAPLREAQAALAFAERDWEKAERALRAAEQLGAPSWRLAYHRGLLAEARSDRTQADAEYRLAQQQRPGWASPGSRLRGLLADAVSDAGPHPMRSAPAPRELSAGLAPKREPYETAAHGSAAAPLTREAVAPQPPAESAGLRPPAEPAPQPVPRAARVQEPEPPRPRAAPRAPQYFLELAGVSPSEAGETLASLRAAGFPVQPLTGPDDAAVAAGGIRLGPYPSAAQARRTARELEAQLGKASRLLLLGS